MDAQPSGRQETWCQETSGHLSQGTGWYLASWSCPAQHCTGMTNHPVPWIRWPNVFWHQVFHLPEGWASIMPAIWSSESIVNLSRIYREPIVNPIIVHLSWIYRGSIVNLSWIHHEPFPDASQLEFTGFNLRKIMEFGLKWRESIVNLSRTYCEYIVNLSWT